jgi:RNA polymerase sigma-70 factor (ECF subfamily)
MVLDLLTGRGNKEGPWMARTDEDIDLVRKSKTGDVSAFGELVERYQSLVVGFCYRLLGNREDAEDIAQETFMRAFGAIRRFQPRAKFSTWLLTIAKNLSLNLLRDERRRGRDVHIATVFEEEIQAVELVPSDNPGPDEALRQNERAERVRRALFELSDVHRTIIVLRDFEGMTYEEIARVMRCRKGTVKSRLSRARNHLKEVLVARGDHDVFE